MLIFKLSDPIFRAMPEHQRYAQALRRGIRRYSMAPMDVHVRAQHNEVPRLHADVLVDQHILDLVLPQRIQIRYNEIARAKAQVVDRFVILDRAQGLVAVRFILMIHQPLILAIVIEGRQGAVEETWRVAKLGF